MDNPSSLVQDTLREIVRETFETLTFSEVSGWEVVSDGPESTDSWIGAEIAIHQPLHCHLTLLLDREQCREFVETACGPEIMNDPGVGRIFGDYIGELVNTIAGRLAAALAQGVGKIELGLPVSVMNINNSLSGQKKWTFMKFSLEGIPGWCMLEE